MTHPQTQDDEALVEAMARAMCAADFERRVAYIKASWETDWPISLNGPFSGLDYKLSAEEWDRSTGLDRVKEQWREHARAALTALRNHEGRK